jgi:uncharacterized protein YegP (UPF0339 family)
LTCKSGEAFIMVTPMYFRLRKDAAGEFRWTLHAEGNRQPLADSGEGYKHIDDCITAIKLIQSDVSAAIIVDDIK